MNVFSSGKCFFYLRLRNLRKPNVCADLTGFNEGLAFGFSRDRLLGSRFGCLGVLVLKSGSVFEFDLNVAEVLVEGVLYLDYR